MFTFGPGPAARLPRARARADAARVSAEAACETLHKALPREHPAQLRVAFQCRGPGLLNLWAALHPGHVSPGQPQTSVRGDCQAVRERFWDACEQACEVGLLLRPVPGVPQFRSVTAAKAWRRACRSATPGSRAFSGAVPGACYLGLLAPRSASGLGGPREAAGPAPAAFNRAGEKLQATGGELPRVWAEAGPQREGGLALPLTGEEGQGHPSGAGG
jgi:hypothetical protein